MYYLYKKSKDNAIPTCDYMFKKFADFYDAVRLLTMPFGGRYNINVKSDSYNDIIRFIDIESSYAHLNVYIEVSESLLDYISLYRPNVQLLGSKSNYEIYEELISKHNVLFDKDCPKVLYFAIGHSYEDMEEALILIKQTYPNQLITKSEISKLFVIDDAVYPRNVMIAYLCMHRGRQYKLKKCVEYFGNDLVFYSMRKQCRKLLEDKLKYFRSGKGSGLVKIVSTNNLIKLLNVLDYGNSKTFKDVYTLLYLYEKGETLDDTLQESAH